MNTSSTIDCKPVAILGSAFGDKPTVVVSTEITSCLEHLDLNITSDYYSSFRRANSKSYKVAAEDYLLGEDERWLDESLLCPEMPLPRHLVSTVRLIAPEGITWTERAVALVHAGRKGCIAPVHFDWDHSWVAHACVIGRKRFFLFPPHAAWLLNPIVNTSAFNISRFSETDRHDLINRLGGTEVLLEAGQGILIPSIFWHGVFYEEPALSVSVRFEECPGGRPFAALPRSWLLQRLVWRFFQEGYGPEAEEFLIGYLKSFFQSTKRWKDRYRRIADLCRRTLLSFGEQQGATELVAENFSAELALATQELRLYYGEAGDIDQPDENDLVLEARDYIFEGLNRLPSAHDLRLAVYALKVRQGLPPKRGLVEIKPE